MELFTRVKYETDYDIVIQKEEFEPTQDIKIKNVGED